MKILRIVLPLTALALLSSFAVSKITTKTSNNNEDFFNKKDLPKKLPVDPTYKRFLEKFDQVAFPYAIKFEKPAISSHNERAKVGNYDKSKYIGSDFSDILPEIKDGMMSRMGPDDFIAEALIKNGDKFDAVIYSRQRSFRASKSFFAATYDKKGKLISKIDIGDCNYENIKEFSVSENLEITVEKTKVRSMYDENIEKNKNSYAKIGKDVYTINAEGRFVNKDLAAGLDMGMN